MKNIKLFLSIIVAVIFAVFSCDSNPYKQGAILYTNFCANCHMEDGSGLKGLIPPLAQADYLDKFATDLPCIIRYGLAEEIVVNGRTYSQPMQGIKELSDVEIANVINYINNAWNNNLPPVKLETVRQRLQQCD